MKKEIIELRKLMMQEGIDLYITKDADDHISEYNDRYFSTMEFLSGFTGGDGTLVITGEEAALWTDGRYFIQAAAELEGSGVQLMKEGEPGCPEMADWIFEKMPEGGTLGFDGRCISHESASGLLRKLSSKKCSVKCDRDLAGEIWTGRPEKTAEKIWILKEEYAGVSAAEKIGNLKRSLKDRGAEAAVLSAMDETAWLLNLRGWDVPYCPVFDAFFLLDGDSAVLYVSEPHLTGEIRAYLSELGITVKTDTDAIYSDVAAIRSKSILIDQTSCSYRLVNSVPRGVEILFAESPVMIAKGHKNPVEMKNLEKAQIKDSTAVIRYMYWFLKELEQKKEMTEMSTARKLHEFRAEQEGFLGDSFETISAYGPNAAMCHYGPSDEAPVAIEPKGLYLVDSGGHYPEGTTDITRTWACGPVTEEEKKAYTLTAVANLRLADEVFPEHTSGHTLDLAAREVYWREGLDFNHGTGHGVGYLLYVHEGPSQFRFRANRESFCNEMVEGVYISDEPGFYAEGKFGVRLENMVLVEKAFTNEFRTFMKLHALTLVPFDRRCMDKNYMNERDVQLYNEYHRRVYDAISCRLPVEEQEWLKNACAPL